MPRRAGFTRSATASSAIRKFRSIRGIGVAIHAWDPVTMSANPALAGGRTVAPRWSLVRRALVIASVWLVGCFYVEPINQRPSIDIRAPGTPIFRGDMVTIEAVADDPEDQLVLFTWRAYLC